MAFDFLRYELNRLNQKKAAEEKRREEKIDLLVDSTKREKLVEDFTLQFRQSKQKPKFGKSGSRLAAIEATETKPMQGYSTEVNKVFTEALKDNSGKLDDYSPKELLYNVGTNLLTAERPGGSLLERAHKYKLEQDTSLPNAWFGGDKSIGALPGYEEYRQKVAEQKVESHYTNPIVSGALGAGTAAAFHYGKAGIAKVLGRTLIATRHPVAMLGGAALLAVPSFFATDVVSNVVNKSLWGKAREGTWKKTAVDWGLPLIAGVGADIGASKLIRKGLTKAVASGKISSRSTLNFFSRGDKNAADAIKVGFAQRRAAKAQTKLDNALIFNEDSVKEAMFKTMVTGEEIMAPGVRTLEGGSLSKMKLAKPKSLITEAEETLEARTLKEGVSKTELEKVKRNELLGVIDKQFDEELGVLDKKRLAGERFNRNILTSPQQNEAAITKSLQGEAGEAVKGIKKELSIEQLSKISPEAADWAAVESGAVNKVKGSKIETVKNKQLANAIADDILVITGEKTESVVAKSLPTVEKFKKLSDDATDWALRNSEEKGIVGATEEAFSIDSFLKKGVGKDITEVVKTTEGKKAKLTSTLVKASTEVVEKKGVTKIPEKGKIELLREKLTQFSEKNKELIEDVKTGRLEKERKAELAKLIAEQEDDILQDKIFSAGTEDIEEDFVKRKIDLTDIFKAVAIPVASLASIGLLFPDPVDASIAGSIGKTFTSKGGMKWLERATEKLTGEKLAAQKLKIARDSVEAGLSAVSVKEGETVLKSSHRMITDALDVARIAGENLGSVNNAANAGGRGRIPQVLFNMMTPGNKGEFLYGKFNPEIQIAHGQTAVGYNTANVSKLAYNIMKKVPGAIEHGGSEEIIKATTGVAKNYASTVVGYSTAEFRLDKLNKIYETTLKSWKESTGTKAAGKAAALKKLEDEIINTQQLKVKLKPAFDKFNAEMDVIDKDLARKYSTSRISLAVEDTVDFQHRPWLKGMLTFEEKVAVKEFRNLYDTYEAELVRNRVAVIKERPFVHHAFHPEWNSKVIEAYKDDLNIGAAIPFAKFFRRTKHSRQMVPDIMYNTLRYIPETEKRLWWKSFWGKGKTLESGKRDTNTWWRHKNSGVVRGSETLTKFWKDIIDASKPFEDSTGNRLANKYTAFEVARLLSYIPSPAFKHAFKQIGQAAQMGVGNYLTHVIPAAKMATKNGLRNLKGISPLLDNATGKERNSLVENMAASMTHQGRMMNQLADLELGSLLDRSTMSKWDKGLESFNWYGSVPIRMVEYLDRTHTFLSALDMSAKKGMTAQQAAYGFYSTSLKNNFMSQALNPRWMRDPKIRAVMLFQQTPFKVLDRRVTQAIKAGRAVGAAVKVGKEIFKDEGLLGLAKDLAGLKRTVINGEIAFKQSLIFDALKTETDFFGTSITKQFMREALIVGGMIYGGARMFDLDVTPHTMHLPFIGFHGKEPSVALNPALKSFFKTMAERKEAFEEGEDYDFFITSFLGNYLKSTNYMPSVVNKALRLAENDIPDVYNGSPLQYLFAVPSPSTSGGIY